MSFEIGAWIAGVGGTAAGVLLARLSGPVFRGSMAWFDSLVGAGTGAVFALVAYGFFSLLEGWAAFFSRPASPVVPLLFTFAMLAVWVVGMWASARWRRTER